MHWFCTLKDKEQIGKKEKNHNVLYTRKTHKITWPWKSKRLKDWKIRKKIAINLTKDIKRKKKDKKGKEEKPGVHPSGKQVQIPKNMWDSS